MTIHLVQFRDGGKRAAGIVEESRVRVLDGVGTVYALAGSALRRGTGLEAAARAAAGSRVLSYDELTASGRLLPPLDHPDPAHCLVSGTGLTHLGSAASRDAMHQAAREAAETDSMRMFRMGIERGKPAAGQTGVQPEWFYKGDGSIVVPPGGDLPVPDFTLDAGEEAEVVGLYLIDDDGMPRRLGFAIGNELSDHVMERQNYLYLAHSKLRRCAYGPELCAGPLPGHLEGTSRIRRHGRIVWEKTFVSGEANMSHSLANLEHHHFKYSQFRRPGDVHVHFFGATLLSFSDQVVTEEDDEFEIAIPALGRSLINRLKRAPASRVEIRAL